MHRNIAKSQNKRAFWATSIRSNIEFYTGHSCAVLCSRIFLFLREHNEWLRENAGVIEIHDNSCDHLHHVLLLTSDRESLIESLIVHSKIFNS